MKAIVAMDLNRGIGLNGKIPWHLSEDLKFFKEKTTGGALLMGRKTFDGVGRLSNRWIYILNKTLSGPYISDGFGSVIKYINPSELDKILKIDNLWLCGGAEMYKQFISLCDEVYVTIILDKYECDIKLHYFEDDFPNQKIIRQEQKYWIVKYSK